MSTINGNAKPQNGQGTSSAPALSRRKFINATTAGALGLAATQLSAGHAIAEPDMETSAVDDAKIVLAKEGSFYIGGRKVKGAGKFDAENVIPANNQGGTFWINQMYANYQIPPNARSLPIVFWHGGGLTGHAWESTSDGRAGFQTLFVKKGYSVYTIDQPGRGRGNTPTFNGPFGRLDETEIISNITTNFSVEAAWLRDRLGPIPGKFFKNTQFPEGFEPSYFKQMGLITTVPATEIIDAVVELFDRIGPAILITHSGSGALGLRTAVRSRNVRGIVSYEPSVSVFPQGQVPQIPLTADGTPTQPPFELPEADFKQLAKIPIQIVFGDNIPKKPFKGNYFLDAWRVIRYAQAKSIKAINSRGGRASMLDLPDVGLEGNTHFSFTDRNNKEVASVLARYLRQNNLSDEGAGG